MGFLISTHAFSQRVVDQWAIEPSDSVFLSDPMTIQGFIPPLGIGSEFPDFQTITTNNEVLTRDYILAENISNSTVPVIVFGRPSCNFMRAAYKELVLPMQSELNGITRVYHIANSIEVHATNGYESPYYTVEDGITYSGNVTVPDNIGFEFLQPFTGQELIDLTNEYAAKMVGTGVGDISDFNDITILLDDVAGGFTQAFAGPAILWVLDPFTNEVIYERTDFSCYTVAGLSPCQDEYDEFMNAIASVRESFFPVGVDQHETISSKWVQLEGINILGQNSNQYELLYNTRTKKKLLKPAQ